MMNRFIVFLKNTTVPFRLHVGVMLIVWCSIGYQNYQLYKLHGQRNELLQLYNRVQNLVVLLNTERKILDQRERELRCIPDPKRDQI